MHILFRGKWVPSRGIILFMNFFSRKLCMMRDRLGPLWWHTALMFVSSRLGDVLNLIVGLFIVPAVISRDDLGAVLPLTKMASFVALPLLACLGAVLKYLSVFKTKGEDGKIKKMLRDLLWVSLLFLGFVLAVLLFAQDFINKRLRIEDPAILWLIGGLAIINFWNPILLAVMQGLGRFYRLTLSSFIGPVVRFLVILLVLERLQLRGYLLAMVAAGLATISLFLRGLGRPLRSEVQLVSYRSEIPQMVRYAAPVGLMVIMTNIHRLCEPWMVRQWLPRVDSAGFYMAAMFGNIPMWVAPAMLPFLFPLVSELFEKGEKTSRLHVQSLLVVCSIGVFLTVFFGSCSHWLLGLRSAWLPYQSYAWLVGPLCLAVTVDCLIQCHVVHENACRRFLYLRYYLPIVFLEILVFLIILRWPFFNRVFPAIFENELRLSISKDSMLTLLYVMLMARALMVLGLVVELYRSYGRRARPVCVSEN